MIKNDLVDKLSESSVCYGLTKKEIRKIVSELFEIITAAIIDGDEIEIRGFGKWETRHRKPRKINHPSNGKIIMSHSKRVVHFNPARKVKADLRD